MGTIRGDVEVLGISNLLQMLSVNHCKGYLTIQLENQKKVIRFLDEGIRLVSGARRTNPLGEILMRSGKLTRDQLDELLAEQRRTGTPLGELVSQRGIVETGVIQSALREQVAEEIYDLFTWAGATFTFEEYMNASETRSHGGPLSSVVLDTSMMSLMLEAARRLDELQQIHSVIPDIRLVAERLELPAELDDPSIDRSAIEDILPLVDGERSVGHILEESLFPKFTVLRTLYGLAQRGVIKIRDRGDGSSAPQTVIRRPPSLDDRSATKGQSVLLLSELPTFRQALSMVIRGAGYDVVESRPSDETADVLRRSADVVILDVPLETEDGLAFCRLVRDKLRAPFIILSGNTSKLAVQNALQSGARYVLVKPFKEDLLLERIANVLKGADPSGRMPPNG